MGVGRHPLYLSRCQLRLIGLRDEKQSHGYRRVHLLHAFATACTRNRARWAMGLSFGITGSYGRGGGRGCSRIRLCLHTLYHAPISRAIGTLPCLRACAGGGSCEHRPAPPRQPRRIPGTFEVMRNIVDSRGIAGLYTGALPRVGKVAPACAIMIFSYEAGKRFFAERNAERARLQ